MSEYYKQLREKTGKQLIFNPSVAAIIRNEQGDILFQRPSLSNDNIWSLPAGAIEPGETPSMAIKREVYEETGLHVTPKKLLGVFGGEDYRYTYPDGNQVEYVIFMFECDVQSGELQAIDGESAMLEYFAPSVRPRLALPYPQEIFYPDSLGNTYFQS